MGKRGRKCVSVHTFIDGVEHKVCVLCATPRLLAEFRVNAAKWDGLIARCRPCEAYLRDQSLSMEHDAEKFWRQVRRRGDNECWEWQGPLQCKGYGQLSVLGKNWRAHRYAMFLTHGPLPDDKVVMHSCDNRRCCNPDHLSLGTQTENVADQDRKGGIHRARGVRHGRAKLTEQAVREIRASTETLTVLAKRYGVNWKTVQKARNRIFWSHVN